MKASRFFISTLKEAPADAEIISHQLMVRAGMIRRIAGGIYNYMPIGLRSIRKVEAIIREEMNRTGAIELLMPAVQPAELWHESGRLEQYGPELLRVKDRYDRNFVVGPTHEEVVTDLARREIKSYRQLPINFYQVQTKFRDEIRPRFGVIRGREFIMKDAYSFDRDHAGLQLSYQKMYDAYMRIFTHLRLEFRVVAADNGSIGGTQSHEFHVIAATGEDVIAYCPSSDYAANIEAAEAVSLIESRAAPSEPLTKKSTPGKVKCEEVADYLGITLERIIKSIVLAVDNEGADPTIWLLLLQGNHELNKTKTKKIPGLADYRFATEKEIFNWFGVPPGYLGPLNTRKPVKVVADRTVANMSDFVIGSNEMNCHITGVNWGRDLPLPKVADLRNVRKGDPSPDGYGELNLCRGIEVGHVFQLGTKYSKSMGAIFLDENGKPTPMTMGSYGIGITRILSAAIEQNFDERGIIWPEAIAPFHLVLCPIDYKRNDAVRKQANQLYNELLDSGIEVILDNRGERPGVMFVDWELIGIPHRLVIGERSLRDKKIEYQGRRDAEPTLLPLKQAAPWVVERVCSALVH
ncbi:proline--tRNA ligase [Candidatus Vallotia tarda]|uniref:Proline--tRNA ligase n=1 Tax=Candidatus Vallotiella hemipterorum TaxID=1177213 RepID=A0A916JSA1_9BURK|nr:proline--tRNA ligase [Candidatus Vallotia tarda]CAG7599531.1 Proline--tRNA ligase [Candidatus Vallotia tarda]